MLMNKKLNPRQPGTKRLINRYGERLMRVRYRYRAYKLIGIVMIASPAIAFVLTALLQQYKALTFYVEVVGILAFATY